ncbi:MAG TPA: hypothetical protein VIL69_19320 [Roseomonas sp.]|jgi:hypothetical protein
MVRRDIRIGRIEVTGGGADEAALRVALAEVPGTLRAMLAGTPPARASSLAHSIAREVAAAIRRAAPKEG